MDVNVTDEKLENPRRWISEETQAVREEEPICLSFPFEKREKRVPALLVSAGRRKILPLLV